MSRVYATHAVCDPGYGGANFCATQCGGEGANAVSAIALDAPLHVFLWLPTGMADVHLSPRLLVSTCIALLLHVLTLLTLNVMLKFGLEDKSMQHSKREVQGVSECPWLQVLPTDAHNCQHCCCACFIGPAEGGPFSALLSGPPWCAADCCGS